MRFDAGFANSIYDCFNDMNELSFRKPQLNFKSGQKKKAKKNKNKNKRRTVISKSYVFEHCYHMNCPSNCVGNTDSILL